MGILRTIIKILARTISIRRRSPLAEIIWFHPRALRWTVSLHQNLAASHSKILTQARFHTDRVKLGRPRALDFTAETPPQPDIIDYVCRRADV